MPELPEVENLRLLLAPQLVGQKFHKIELRRKNLRFPLPQNFEERLQESTILKITRRAKYLLFHLDIEKILIVHLGMTGRLLLQDPEVEGDTITSGNAVGRYYFNKGQYLKHDHVVFYIKNGKKITYNDARRFGFMVLVDAKVLHTHPLIKQLGVEPLSSDFDDPYIAKRAAGRRLDLKAFLMDQKTVAGLGNIYVCEALFRAGLSPKRRTGSIVDRSNRLKANATGLVSAVRNVIEEAVIAGGSTLKDFLKPDGSMGTFQNKHLVYDREGEPCLRHQCKGLVRRIPQHGRSTFYCPHCQK